MLGHYNWCVTGNPVRLPYAVNQQTYGWPLTLPWFPTRVISHHDPMLADYYNFELDEHAKLVSPFQNWLANAQDVISLWCFFAGVVFTLPLLWLPRVLNDRRIMPLIAILAVMIGAVALEQTRYPHYFSPATAAVLVLLVQSLRHMRASAKQSRPALAAFVRLIPVVFLVTLVARASPPGQRACLNGITGHFSWCSQAGDNPQRREARERFGNMPGRHLVIVRYPDRSSFMKELIYNEADIDAAKVVWARDLGDARNENLVRYFHGRHVWTLDWTADPLCIAEYRQGWMVGGCPGAPANWVPVKR